MFTICLAITGHGTGNLPVMQTRCTTDGSTTYSMISRTPNMGWSTFQNTENGYRPKAEVAFESQCFSVALEVVGQLGLHGENRRDFLDHPLPEISKCASVRNKPLACFGEVASASEHWR